MQIFISLKKCIKFSFIPSYFISRQLSYFLGTILILFALIKLLKDKIQWQHSRCPLSCWRWAWSTGARPGGGGRAWRAACRKRPASCTCSKGRRCACWTGAAAGRLPWCGTWAAAAAATARSARPPPGWAAGNQQNCTYKCVCHPGWVMKMNEPAAVACAF